MCSLATVLGRVVEVCKGMREHSPLPGASDPPGAEDARVTLGYAGSAAAPGEVRLLCSGPGVAYLWRLRGGRSSSVLGSL